MQYLLVYYKTSSPSAFCRKAAPLRHSVYYFFCVQDCVDCVITRVPGSIGETFALEKFLVHLSTALRVLVAPKFVSLLFSPLV